MNVNTIKTAVTTSMSKIKFKATAKSPELLLAAGIIGFGGAIVSACFATTKAGVIVEETKDAIEEVHEAAENGVTKAGETYDEKDNKRDLTIVYIQSAAKFAKLYAPTVALVTASTVCILASHNIMKKRNVALAAAYAAVERSFSKYRGRVVERFGEQVEKELRYNVKATDIKEKEIDEDGKEKTVKKTVDMANPNFDISSLGPYAVVIDSSHPDWNRNSSLMRYYLNSRETMANIKLRTQGHLFLNEVYDGLGLPRTDIGQQVGWIYDDEHPFGDNFIAFRPTEIRRAKPGEEGDEAIFESLYVLDFNVPGYILDKMESHQAIVR